jgi:hypothetical protein
MCARTCLQARLTNTALASLAIGVAVVGNLEKWVCGTGGLPVHELREVSLPELRRGLGALNDKKLLPSAYDMWEGARSAGLLRLRYTFDVARLLSLPGMGAMGKEQVQPLTLDDEVDSWVRARVTKPAPASRAQVWRNLKRRLYHYDAGVVAFRGFARNFLLSAEQWQDLLKDRPQRPGGLVALDIGAGDGSLSEPFRPMFETVVATELSVPLVLRLRSQGLDARLVESPTAEHLGRDTFDVVFILNVLDRCKDPAAMLRQAASLLPPDGLLAVSVVAPPSQSDAVPGGKRWGWGAPIQLGAISAHQ